MVFSKIKNLLIEGLNTIKEQGLFKDERVIFSPQSSEIIVNEGLVINFCANNYLGLANNKEIIEAAKRGLDTHGYGLSSVRFICGTQDIHKELEKKISEFMKTEDAILYTSCFDANTGLFETLLGQDDAIISDELNHASIIDGIRLCKANRLIFKHMNMDDLRDRLKESEGMRLRMIATDGVFSMDGDLTPLNEITELAEEYDATVMVDDSHSTGFFGPTGRGTAEHFGVMNKIDVTTSTLGKALGGASGGFTTGKKEIVEYLRQRSRPYLFSNSVSPAIVSASLKAIDLIEKGSELRDRLNQNTGMFRKRMKDLGFNIKEGVHPICPVMLGEAKLAKDMADRLLKEGIYVIGFSYPVVPEGKARIRVQISAAHSLKQIERAVEAFEKVGKEMKVI